MAEIRILQIDSQEYEMLKQKKEEFYKLKSDFNIQFKQNTDLKERISKLERDKEILQLVIEDKLS